MNGWSSLLSARVFGAPHDVYFALLPFPLISLFCDLVISAFALGLIVCLLALMRICSFLLRSGTTVSPVPLWFPSFFPFFLIHLPVSLLCYRIQSATGSYLIILGASCHAMPLELYIYFESYVLITRTHHDCIALYSENSFGIFSLGPESEITF
jgi:hypothetical protein